MTNEELLKSISSMLKKHENYLSENPDVFLGIQERLLNAIGYEDLEKNEDDKKKVSKHGYRDWQPKDLNEYTPEQQEEMQAYMDEGWSHREAERFVGAHDPPADFMKALDHKVNPSQPSDKMIEMMREVALNYKKRSAKMEGERADARLQPQKYASHRDLKAHQEAYGDYDKDYKEFLEELDKQDLHPLDYDEAVSKWQEEWHANNPDAKDQMVESADAGKVYGEADKARKERIEEGKMNIIQGGQAGGETGMSQFSEEAAGGIGDDMDMQTAAQMIGGAKGEAGYEASTFKDPAAIFREQNPEYVAELKSKLEKELGKNPEAKERHAAMPPRDRTPKQQPSPVRTLSPEEIQAQYGDKYKIKKPEGGE